MERISYRDQLRHPNWQRKRLEVLGAAGFTCQCCGTSDRMLHVHHRRYIKGRMAWEYENGNFDVLCDSCHKEAHDQRVRLDAVVAALHPEMIPLATALLAGWMSDSFDIDVDIDDLDQDIFHSGRIASYMMNFKFPAAVADDISKIPPDIVQAFVDKELGRS